MRSFITRILSAKGRIGAAAILAFTVLPWHALAAEYEIRMLNHGPDGMMQFDPEFLRIAPGDTVRFLPVDKGHNVQTIPGMIPPGARPFASATDQSLQVTFIVPGIYGYRCGPHGSLGMVGLIVVGKPVNEAAAKDASIPGLARQEFAKLFAQLDGMHAPEN